MSRNQAAEAGKEIVLTNLDTCREQVAMPLIIGPCLLGPPETPTSTAPVFALGPFLVSGRRTTLLDVAPRTGRMVARILADCERRRLMYNVLD
jgi:hypothetical protein